MAHTKVELAGGGRKQIIELNKIRRRYRVLIQMAMARGLNYMRKEAEKRIIPNRAIGKSGGLIRNSRKASMVQPSTPGRLTSRTGKLKHMLRTRLGKFKPSRKASKKQKEAIALQTKK